MATSTFKWLGGEGTGANVNDIGVLPNWLVEQDGSFIAADSLPTTGNTELVESGTITDTGVNFTANTVELLGSGVLLDVTTATFDAASIVSVGTDDAAAVLVEPGVVNNGDFVAADAGANLDLELLADLTNAGTLTAATGGRLSASYDGGTLINTGAVQALAGGTVTLSTVVTNNGIVQAAGGSVMVDVADGSGLLSASDGGTLNATAVNGGSVMADGGSATLGVVSGGTLLEVGGGGTLTIGDAYASVPILFLDNKGTVVIKGAVAGTILGFGRGDEIDLPNATYANLRPITISGTIAFVGGVKLNLAGSNLSASSFSTTSDATGGTVLTAPGLGTDDWLNPVSGAWSNAALWSNTATPDAAAQVLIVSAGNTAFTVAATNDVALSVTMQAVAGTLAVAGSFTAIDGVVDVAGTVALAAGATLTGSAFTALSGGALTLGHGAAVILSDSLATSGSVSLTDDATVRVGTLAVGGTVSLDATSSLAVGGSSNAAAGTMLVATSSTLAPGGSVNVPTLDLASTLAFSTGSDVVVGGAVTGTGTLDVGVGGAPATLEVDASTSFTNTIELDGTLTLQHTAAYHGTVDIAVDAGTAVHVEPNSAFAVFDLRDVKFATAQAVWNASTGIASLGSLVPFGVIATDLGSAHWALASDNNGGTQVTFTDGTVCYAAGTRIATPAGGMPVEALRPGDAVLAREGDAWVGKPVRWVGLTRIDLDRHNAPARAAPIRIRAHAFAPNMPCRDLRLSPDHAVLVDGVLVQAQALVNDATIVREASRGQVTYYHVELDRHAILLAEGLPAESYLDTGNRGWFAAEAGTRPLFPDFAALKAWHADACAPLLLEGAALCAIHARLLARARLLGHRLTDDPGLTVLADGMMVPTREGGTLAWRVTVPAGTRELQLVSRSFVPDERDRAANDRRRLGVAVRALRLDGRALPVHAFGSGWHAPEAEWRWTDGDARLSLRPRRQAARLTIRAAGAGLGYWDEPALCDAA